MMDKVIWGVPSFWIERLPLYYGRWRGYFRERGIDLQIRYLWGGPELAAAVSKGEVWIGEMGLPPFLKACAEGMPAVAIGSSTIQQLDHYLVSRPDIMSITDLKKRRIGILSAGSCDEYFARVMLKASSVDPDRDVQLVALGSAYGDARCFSPDAAPEIPKVEAGFLVEPFVARAERLGWIRILAAVRDFFPRYQWGVILARRDAVRQRLPLIRRAMDAFRVSCRGIAEHPDEAASFGAQVFRIPKEDFRRALKRDLGRWELDAMLDLEGMENCLEVQKQMGSVPAGLVLEGMIRQL
jgi:NitT/TauT family transport system substrate-binding protein